MADKLLVLAVSRYDFTPDGGGERLRGCKVFTMEGGTRSTKDQIGSMPAEMPADYDVFGQFQGQNLPAYFDIDLAVTGGAKGKIGVKVSKATFLHGLHDKPAPVRVAA